jgi:hypothetical protein
MGVARALAWAVLLFAGAAAAKESASFTRPVAQAEVDWSAGTITAQGGAAADLRMPNPQAARPGAERRARKAAEEKLRGALRELLPGRDLAEAPVLGHATVARIEYQSDGGVVLWLALRFADVVPAKPAAVALRAATLPLAFAPVLSAGGKSAALGFATYRPAADCPKNAIAVRRDAQGRLALSAADAKLVDSLAGAAVVIYLEKPQP